MANMSSPYQKLKHERFRLLRLIRPASYQELHFCLREHSVRSAPSYTAISYTWGNDVKSHTIYVNGHKLMVRSNLFSSLHCLGQTWQYVWADAICINQDDLDERQQQVRMMDQIYKQAAVVSVWLGSAPLPDFIHVEGPLGVLEVDDIDWDDNMHDLASRSYWQRTWIIQEFLLARDIHIYCSNIRVGVELFRDILSRSTGQDLLAHSNLDAVKDPRIIRKWPAIPLFVGRYVDRYPEYAQSLYELLEQHAYAQCSDARDKVFSFMSLLPRDERRCLELVFPDYTLSEIQVYVVTIAHIWVFEPRKPIAPVLQALGITCHKDLAFMQDMAQRCDYPPWENSSGMLNFITEEYRFATLICEANERKPKSRDPSDVMLQEIVDQHSRRAQKAQSSMWSPLFGYIFGNSSSK